MEGKFTLELFKKFCEELPKQVITRQDKYFCGECYAYLGEKAVNIIFGMSFCDKHYKEFKEAMEEVYLNDRKGIDI